MEDEKQGNGKLIQKLSGLFTKFFSKTDPAKKFTTETDPNAKGAAGGWYKIISDWYKSNLSVSGERANRYDQYRFLDSNLSEATHSLNLYADNVVSGAIGGNENYKVAIDEKTPNIEELERVVKDLEKQTQIKAYIWDIVRDLIRDGDNFEEVVIADSGAGAKQQFFIEKLKKLPSKEIFADVDETGAFKDPLYPYYQKQERYDEIDNIKFNNWRLIHFKLGRGIYGANSSLFSDASLRTGKQLLWIDDSMVLARMSRAYMRFVYLINTTGLTPEDAWAYTQRYADRVKRKEIVSRSTGNVKLMESPLMNDDDIFLPSGDEPGATKDVKQLSGDLNIGNIADVKYLQGKFLMSVGIPKAYAGLEEGVRAKATLTQLDVQFARQVRRKQELVVPGLRKFYELGFVLAGFDPSSFDWEIVFPELNTTDELMLWEKMKVQVEIAKILMVDINAVNNEWLYREILGFSEEEIEKYGVVMPPPDEGYVDIPDEVAKEMRKDPMIRTIIDDLRDIVATRNARYEMLQDKRFVGDS